MSLDKLSQLWQTVNKQSDEGLFSELELNQQLSEKLHQGSLLLNKKLFQEAVLGIVFAVFILIVSFFFDYTLLIWGTSTFIAVNVLCVAYLLGFGVYFLYAIKANKRLMAGTIKQNLETMLKRQTALEQIYLYGSTICASAMVAILLFFEQIPFIVNMGLWLKIVLLIAMFVVSHSINLFYIRLRFGTQTKQLKDLYQSLNLT